MSAAYWMTFANQNQDYARWLERVDVLCDQLVDIRYSDLLYEAGFDPLEDYQRNMRPERYLSERVIPYLQCEHGAETIFEVIGENVVWGGGIQEDA